MATDQRSGAPSRTEPLRDRLAPYAIHAVLILASVIALAPFVWTVLVTFKEPGTIIATIDQPFPTAPTLANYAAVWTEQPLDRWLLNSLILTTGAVFLSVTFDSLAGFALAKGRFSGRSLLFTFVIGTLVIPPQSVMVAVYAGLQGIDLHNTYWGMMAMFVANPFGTFMMRQFFVGIPDELLEAARMDGCSRLQTFLRVMLPMAKPALSSLSIFLFVFTWGGFLWPLVITNNDAMFPLQVGLALLRGQYGTAWGSLLAATVLAALPVLAAYAVAQRSFMEGIALQGAK